AEVHRGPAVLVPDFVGDDVLGEVQAEQRLVLHQQHGIDLPADEPEQPLIRAAGPYSLLDNPGTDGGDDRPPEPVPMYPYGWEKAGDPLFGLEPERKG
ncbi:MAG TPA: hypothetical protein VF157_02560, partial [Chloroflexota bacterium]